MTHDQEDTYTYTYSYYRTRLWNKVAKHAWKLVRNCYGSMRDVFVQRNLSIIETLYKVFGNFGGTFIPSLIADALSY